MLKYINNNINTDELRNRANVKWIKKPLKL